MNFFTTFRAQVQRRLYAAIATLSFFTATGDMKAQEAPTTVVAGTRVTLTATADGSPAPTFQWRKNGNPIADATNAILVIAVVALEDAAKYTVVATNSAGSAVSPEAELLVQPAPPPLPNTAIAPTITAQPTGVVGVAGGTAIFNVSVTGTPAPTLQWLKNGAPVSGWNASTLTLPALTVNDVATYKVVVTNEAGSVTSSDAQLSIQDPSAVASVPVITSQPINVVSTTGGNATFSVNAIGTPTPTYQWYKNSTPISAATNAVLNLVGLTSSDVGAYKVAVSNTAGSVTSGDAQLSIQDPTPTPVASLPVISNQPADVVSTTGGNATFSVSATGTPAPTYQWYKNGTPINAATNAVFNLSGLTSNDVAAYKVAVTNSAGSVTSNSVTLSLQVPSVAGTVPVFTTQPTSQTANSGQSVTFSAVISGTPQPTLQWRKNGATISGATSATLTLSSISSTDAAAYTLIAINVAGTTLSSEATLAVGSAPKFTKQPTPTIQSTPVGGSVRLSAAASGTPAPSYQWQKNGVSMNGATDAELVLANATLADSALYTVIAINPSGAAMSQKAEVVVGGAATNVSAPVITAQPFSQATVTKAAVTFRATVSGSPAPALQWRRNGIDIAGATSASFTLASATRFDAGEYTLFARNDYGSTLSIPAQLTVSAGNGAVSSVGGGAAPADSSFDENISRIVNLSVRASAGSGADSLIVGFVVSEGAQKPVLVRGIGPTLGLFGVADALQDPMVSLYSGPVLASANDDWGSNNNASEIRTRAAQVGAFSLSETANDAALISILRSGTYTAQLTGQGSESGTALIEVYDGASKDGGRLINVSTRARVGSGGDVPNIGFVIEGIQPKKVLIRAVGPTLAAFGVKGVLTDPQLELFEGPSRLQHNDDWNGSSTLSQAFNKVGAFSFSDALSKDAALLVTLEPGAYTAVVSGVNGSTGTVLVEVYEVQ